MSGIAVSVFDTTVEKTNEWLDEISAELGWQGRHGAYIALRTTLHALRDRLPASAAVKLGAQLPMLVRGMYYEGWHLGGKPLKVRHRNEFLDQVTEECRTDLDAPVGDVVRAVFRVLEKHVSEGETSSVMRALPGELRSLWP